MASNTLLSLNIKNLRGLLTSLISTKTAKKIALTQVELEEQVFFFTP